MKSFDLLPTAFEDVARAVGNLEIYSETVGDSVKLCAVASKLEGLEDDFCGAEQKSEQQPDQKWDFKCFQSNAHRTIVN